MKNAGDNMKSLWAYGVDLPQFPELKGDKSCDVLIIGGGLTGILTAYFLEQKGINYILVEKERICNGTTGNTTAKITFQHGLIYDKIIRNIGAENAEMYLNANISAFEKYSELCRDIDCDYEIKDNYVYTLCNRQKLEDEVEALRKIGYSAEFSNADNLPFKTLGAVKFPNQAQFHPLKFISQIAKDLNIYENTKVAEMIGNTAITKNGKIKAEKVIVATHFPFINKHGSYYLKLYQHRSYVCAFEGAADVNGMYVDESHSGLSFRNYKNLLLIGGGGHRTGKKSRAWQEIREKAKSFYPGSKEEFFWAAQDCISLDSVPYIGRYSKNTPQMFTATGFNKWGITGAMTAAMILSDIVTERENEYADAFCPSRSILKPQLLINGFEAVTNLLTPTNKRCPHLGCALKWNPHEHSWDCPCHGSRFSVTGRVLENPANGDLKNDAQN